MLYFNKFTNYKYSIEKEYEGGLALVGNQVKEIRAGKMNLKECNVRVVNGEVWVLNTGLNGAKIKVLLNKQEIRKIDAYLDEKRHHAFVIGIFTKGRLLKIKLGTGIVKTQYQKTEQQKRKDAKIELRKEFKEKRFEV